MIGTHDQSVTKGPAIVIGRKGSFGEVTFAEEPCWPIDTAFYIEEFGPFEPWYLYRLEVRTAFGVGLREPHGASRWRF